MLTNQTYKLWKILNRPANLNFRHCMEPTDNKEFWEYL